MSQWVHLDVTLIHKASEKAFLLELEDGELVWIPRSQVSAPDDYAAGDQDVTVSVTEWIAQQKGLES